MWDNHGGRMGQSESLALRYWLPARASLKQFSPCPDGTYLHASKGAPGTLGILSVVSAQF